MDLPVEELLQFMQPDARVDVRRIAVEYVMGLTAAPEQAQWFVANPAVVEALVRLTTNPACQEHALSACVNLSDNDALSQRMIRLGMVKTCISVISDPNYENPDTPCMLLANLTRHDAGARDFMAASRAELPRLVDIFCKSEKFNKKGTFHHLASVFYNITQLDEGRDALLASDCLLDRLLPFTRFEESAVRRVGIMGIVRNCCFDTHRHDQLTAAPVDVLPSLLLPLAGPEELDEDDMDGLPDDLQYLPPTKTRDACSTVRKLALESLLQLCATRAKRDMLRRRKAYPILREMHLREDDEEVKDSCEMVVQALIAEEDPTVDNIKEFQPDAPRAAAAAAGPASTTGPAVAALLAPSPASVAASESLPGATSSSSNADDSKSA